MKNGQCCQMKKRSMKQQYRGLLANMDLPAFVQAWYTIGCDSLVSSTKQEKSYSVDGHEKTAT